MFSQKSPAPHSRDFLISPAEGQFYWTNFHNHSGFVSAFPALIPKSLADSWRAESDPRRGRDGGHNTVPVLLHEERETPMSRTQNSQNRPVVF